MTKYLTDAFPPTILSHLSDENISIYMPTHRTSPDNKQDQLLYKNIMNNLQEQLNGSNSDLFKQLKKLELDLDFWIYNLDGLAILANENNINIYRLPRSVQTSLHIGDDFYLKPLIRNYQSDHRYFALGLAKKEFTLYSGNRYGFKEMKLPENVSTKLEDVLGHDYTDKRLNVVSHGGTVGNFHGHGSRSEEEKIDTRKFFHYIDQFSTKLCNKYKIPLILIALPEHQGLYRQISNNPYLLDKGIHKDYESIDYNTLHTELWEVLEPVYLEKTTKLINAFENGKSKDLSSDVIQDILYALKEKRVHQLIIESDRIIEGIIHENFDLELKKGPYDVLNKMSQIALEQKIEVIILPKDKMPTHKGAFAIFRY